MIIEFFHNGSVKEYELPDCCTRVLVDSDCTINNASNQIIWGFDEDDVQYFGKLIYQNDNVVFWG
jgi:hypothetical protein